MPRKNKKNRYHSPQPSLILPTNEQIAKILEINSSLKYAPTNKNNNQNNVDLIAKVLYTNNLTTIPECVKKKSRIQRLKTFLTNST